MNEDIIAVLTYQTHQYAGILDRRKDCLSSLSERGKALHAKFHSRSYNCCGCGCADKEEAIAEIKREFAKRKEALPDCFFDSPSSAKVPAYIPFTILKVVDNNNAHNYEIGSFVMTRINGNNNLPCTDSKISHNYMSTYFSDVKIATDEDIVAFANNPKFVQTFKELRTNKTFKDILKVATPLEPVPPEPVPLEKIPSQVLATS